MSHVDDGAIHAFLDGALADYPDPEAAAIRGHLSTCAECARRLDEEREVRDAARVILDASAPRVELPPLEDLRAVAAHRKHTAGVRGLTRLTRWSWAASIVLALGVGWMLRGAGGGTGLVSMPQVQGRAAEPSGTTPASTPEGDEQGGAEEGGGSARADRAEEGAGSRPGLPDVSETAEMREAAVAEAPSVPGAEADAVATALDRAASLSEGAASGAASGGLLDATAAADRPTEPVGSGRSPGAEERRGPGTAAAAPASPARKMAMPAVDAARLRREASSADAPAPAEDEVVSADAVTPPVRVDGEALAVPGLAVLEIARLREGGPEAVVRVRQLMENGDTLEIFHLPAALDPSDLPVAPSDTRTRLTARRGEGWVVLAANAELRRLAGYLERLGG